jgi:hypothetical protein
MGSHGADFSFRNQASRIPNIIEIESDPTLHANMG